MSDTIKRQQAIDALEKCHKKCCREDSAGDEWIHYGTAVNEVECVPPVQPSIPIDWIKQKMYAFGVSSDPIYEIAAIVLSSLLDGWEEESNG